MLLLNRDAFLGQSQKILFCNISSYFSLPLAPAALLEYSFSFPKTSLPSLISPVAGGGSASAPSWTWVLHPSLGSGALRVSCSTNVKPHGSAASRERCRADSWVVPGESGRALCSKHCLPEPAASLQHLGAVSVCVISLIRIRIRSSCYIPVNDGAGIRVIYMILIVLLKLRSVDMH